MSRSKVAVTVGLLGAMALSVSGGSVVAQQRPHVNAPRGHYGTLSLAPGFTPDPNNTNIVTGGNIDASALGLGAGCVGNIAVEPDVVLNMTGDSPSLRVYVTIPNASPSTATDATLVVNTAHGQWVCNDDSFGGANPSVDLHSTGAGHYDIWVGSYVAGSNTRGVLHVTELSSNHP